MGLCKISPLTVRIEYLYSYIIGHGTRGPVLLLLLELALPNMAQGLKDDEHLHHAHQVLLITPATRSMLQSHSSPEYWPF